VSGVDVGVAEATRLDPHQDLASSGLGNWSVLEHQGAIERCDNGCAHEESPIGMDVGIDLFLSQPQSVLAE
jgi:hypothetical protein